MIDPTKRGVIALIGMWVVTGCGAAEPTNRSVTTLAFNYSSRYIGDVVVDGTWTGGVDAYGMGGGAQGLLAPSNPSRTVSLKVKWIVADDYDVVANKYSRRPDEPHEASVKLARPYPANPSYLVLHFYADGRVEAELEADHPKRRIPQPPGYHR